MDEKKPASKPKYNMWQCSVWMVSQAWNNNERGVLSITFFLAFFAVGMNLVNLYIAPTILAVVERHGSFGELIATILLFTALLMLCRAAIAWMDDMKIFGRTTVRISAIMGDISNKCCMTSYSNQNEKSYQELRKKAFASIQSNGSSAEAIWNTLQLLLQNVAGFAIYAAILMTVNPWLAVIILVTALIGYFVNQRLGNYSYKHREELAELDGRLIYHVFQTGKRENGKDVRIFHMLPWLNEMRDQAADAYIAFHRKEQGYYLWGSILNVVLTFLRDGIAYAYLIYLVVNGQLTVSAFLLYFNAVSGFAEWVTGVLENLLELHRQSLDISTICEFLEYPESFLFEDGEPIPNRDRHIQHEIRLEHVSFRYPEAESDTLTDINLTIRPGEKLAVVGVNGAGKTTLVKIICGLFDPTEGRVLLDGEDIRKYNRREYYLMFSAVFQQFLTLPATVAANVAQSEDAIDREQVREAIRLAGLTEKIESLPKQYDTNLVREVYDDATDLSGGEMQRLMLARALYKDAPIVLLDEPTAALDPLAEADLYMKYNEMTVGRSSVYISHRLASTRFCDHVLLLDGHCIAEEGTHEELLAQGGIYAQMYAVQSKYYSSSPQTEDDKEQYMSGQEVPVV
ncbi:MAG: ABC transporter ATP-binding protein/permease [Clostridiales bacterium]|nr:ABC transporter ATP-binding protein/permease [Clostridiales bacterium]